MDNFLGKLPPEVFWVILAVFGGIARYLHMFLETDKPIIAIKLFSSVFVSAFAGFVTAQTVILLYREWVYVAAGVGGFLSTRMIDVLTDMAANRLNIKINKDIDKKNDTE